MLQTTINYKLADYCTRPKMSSQSQDQECETVVSRPHHWF